MNEEIDDNICPLCEKRYGFINCKVTDHNKGKSWCLTCGAKEEREAAKVIHNQKMKIA